MVERAIQEVEGRVRAIFLNLEERMKITLDARERIVSYIPEFAAYLLNRLHRAKDGKTVYERTRGKSMKVPAIEFGERVLYKLSRKNRKAKIQSRWAEAIFVGVRRKNNEIILSREEGLVYARSVRRVVEERKWLLESILASLAEAVGGKLTCLLGS